jgi:hypothetical protein
MEYFMKVGPWRTKANMRQLYLHEIRFYLHEIRGYLVEIGYKLLKKIAESVNFRL